MCRLHAQLVEVYEVKFRTVIGENVPQHLTFLFLFSVISSEESLLGGEIVDISNKAGKLVYWTDTSKSNTSNHQACEFNVPLPNISCGVVII